MHHYHSWGVTPQYIHFILQRPRYTIRITGTKCRGHLRAFKRKSVTLHRHPSNPNHDFPSFQKQPNGARSRANGLLRAHCQHHSDPSRLPNDTWNHRKQFLKTLSTQCPTSVDRNPRKPRPFQVRNLVPRKGTLGDRSPCTGIL